MSLSEIWQTFVSNIKETRWQEWVSTITQVASVWYARKNNVLVYPTGIIGVLLAAYVYFFQTNPPLYADASLNIYYFLMSVYGWYNWVQKKNTDELSYPISWCDKKELWFGIGFFLFFWIVIYVVLHLLTNSNTPVLDSLVSASAVTAMWWMAKRKIENWIAWIFSNIVAIPLNFYKGLMLFTVMYVLFLVLAWMGYVTWKRMMFKGSNSMKKIVVIGPESTGKSTLCQQLAEHYKTVWCAEYAREYLETQGKDYKFEDLLTIAKGQLKLEDGCATQSKNELIFIDTNMYVMQVWCEYVFDKCHQFILDEIVNRKYDLYLLCNIDLPWTYDELREYPDEQPRKELYRIYKELMINQSVQWVEISGNYDDRLKKAIAAVDKII